MCDCPKVTETIAYPSVMPNGAYWSVGQPQPSPSRSLTATYCPAHEINPLILGGFPSAAAPVSTHTDYQYSVNPHKAEHK